MPAKLRAEEESRRSEEEADRRVSERRAAEAEDSGGEAERLRRRRHARKLATGDRRPATGDRRPATGDRRPATGDRRPATGDRRLYRDPRTAMSSHLRTGRNSRRLQAPRRWRVPTPTQATAPAPRLHSSCPSPYPPNPEPVETPRPPECACGGEYRMRRRSPCTTTAHEAEEQRALTVGIARLAGKPLARGPERIVAHGARAAHSLSRRRGGGTSPATRADRCEGCDRRSAEQRGCAGEGSVRARSLARRFSAHGSHWVRSGAGGCFPHFRHSPFALRSATRR